MRVNLIQLRRPKVDIDDGLAQIGNFPQHRHFVRVRTFEFDMFGVDVVDVETLVKLTGNPRRCLRLAGKSQTHR
jgi:hypothetical protein